MIQINLMPDVKQELLRAQRVRMTVVSVAIITGIVAIAVVAVLAVYVYGVQTARSLWADNTIEDQAAELAQVEDLSETLTIQNQLATMDSVDEQRKINSRLYDMLEVVVPGGDNEVTISRFVIDASPEVQGITLEAQSVAGYQAAEQFKKTLEAAVINYTDEAGEQQQIALASDISLSETSYGEDQNGNMVLRFTLSFMYSAELLASTDGDVTVTIPEDAAGNVTDSYVGVPRSIFADRAEDVEEEN